MGLLKRRGGSKDGRCLPSAAGVGRAGVGG